MKRLFPLVLILFIAGPVSGMDRGERERAFVRSLELFDSAKSKPDYEACARELESILADGFRNGAVYYNLGNAYYRAGEFGRAILNYRKALPYRPRDAYLRANLDQAIAAAPGRLVANSRNWTTHLFFWTEWLSYPWKVWLTSIATAGAAILLASAVLFRKPRLRLMGALMLVLSVPLGLDTGLAARDIFASRRAVITGETIARKGTANSYEAAFDQPLRDGAEFTILSETPEWTFGHFDQIGDGWVRNEFVAK